MGKLVNTSPLVSVLMTAYNREKYITEAIESVIGSTYQNWELIIVDDGSTDGTLGIARSYEGYDNRIKVFVNEKNLGDYPNRNKAASFAKGKYLKYVDADDMIYPHGLSVMVESMEKFPSAAIGLCQDQNNKHFYPYMVNPIDAYLEHFFNKSFLANAPTSAIIKADVFFEIGGFSGQRHIGDYELWLKIAQKHDVVVLVNGLSFWREHNSQERYMGTLNFKREMLNYQLEMEILNSTDCPLSIELRQSAIWRINRKNVRKFYSILRKRDFTKAFKYAKAMKLPFLHFIKALR